MSRDPRTTFYERFAGEFDAAMNRYDLRKRLELVVDEFLGAELRGARVLDAGCGTGHFSQRAAALGARVVSLDVGPALLRRVAEKCESEPVVGSVLALPFADESFDAVICSEVIEHTPDPFGALPELHRVLRAGGLLALTVPNRAWKWACHVANALKLRPYEGLENWVGFAALKRALRDTGFQVEDYRGFHLFPFTLPLSSRVLPRLDRWGGTLGGGYLNIGAKCRRPAGRAASARVAVRA